MPLASAALQIVLVTFILMEQGRPVEFLEDERHPLMDNADLEEAGTSSTFAQHNSHDWQCCLLHMLALELSVDISLRLLFLLSTYIRCPKLPARQVMCKVACTTRVWDSSVTDHLV